MDKYIGFFVFVIAAVCGTEYTIDEELPNNTFIGNIPQDAHLTDMYDAQSLRKLRYTFLVPNQRLFMIEPQTGVIRTAEKIDRDELCPGEEICLQAMDVAVGPHEFFRVIPVTVEIVDINDNRPSFGEGEVSTVISESASMGTAITLPIPEDLDSPKNGLKQYQILPPSSVFEIRDQVAVDGSIDLQLVLMAPLDREVKDSYRFRVVAYDGGIPSKSGSVTVNVEVEDANDNTPKFSNSTYHVNIPENLRPNVTILTITATDADIDHNGEITYAFTPRTSKNNGRQFGIDARTGDIYLKRTVDAEQVTTYHLGVIARDQGAQSKKVSAMVIVNIQDMNDNRPEITVNALIEGTDHGAISERATIGTFVAHVQVRDNDKGSSGVVSCRVNDTNFSIEEMHGAVGQYKIITNNMFDREDKDQYVVMVTCEDQGSPPQKQTYNLTVDIKDVNDQAPIFNQSVYRTSMQENNIADAFVVRVHATDKDAGDNAKIRYTLTPESAGYFRIIHDTGVIRVARNLDYEEVQKIEFRVIATDQGSPPQSATTTVIVNIDDRNDNPPVFIQNNYSFGIFENMSPGAEVGVVNAYDADSEMFSEVEYVLSSPDQFVLDAFDIDSFSGQLTTKIRLDREGVHVYELDVLAFNPGYDLTSSASITVYIADVNDNAPEFVFPSLYNDTVHVSSAVPHGYVVTRVRARDDDIGDNAQLLYAIINGNNDGLFDMDETTGAITVTTDLYTYGGLVYNLSVEVVDSGDVSLTAIDTLHICINASLPYESHNPLLKPQDEEASSANSLIVIGVGCASGAIIVALVIAILAIRLQDSRRKQDRRYNCRMEAQKMLHMSPGLADSTSDKDIPAGGVPNMYGPPAKYPIGNTGGGSSDIISNASSGDNNIQMGAPVQDTMASRTSSFNDSGSLSKQFLLDRANNRTPTTTWERSQSPRQSPGAPCPAASHKPALPRHPAPTLHSFSLPQTEVGHHGYNSHHGDPYSVAPLSHGFPAHAAAVNKQHLAPLAEDVQMHPVSWTGPRPTLPGNGDHDNESACSGEMSNTDSGRGGSEEGENHHHHGNHNGNRLSDLSSEDAADDKQLNNGCHGNKPAEPCPVHHKNRVNAYKCPPRPPRSDSLRRDAARSLGRDVVPGDYQDQYGSSQDQYGSSQDLDDCSSTSGSYVVDHDELRIATPPPPPRVVNIMDVRALTASNV